MKRIISLLLTISMAFLLTCSALATTITDPIIDISAQQDIVNKVSEMLPLLCDIPSDAQCAIGSPLPAYRLEDSGLNEIDYEVYPVYCNGDIVALAQVPKVENGTDYINCVTTFADGLNEFCKENLETSFALVYASEGIFTLTPNGETHCIYSTIHEGLAEISELVESEINYIDIHSAQISLLNDAIISTTNANVMRQNALQANSAQASTVQYKILDINIVSNDVHDCSGSGTAEGICWAACIATIVNYQTGTDWTAMEIHDEWGCAGTSASGARYAEMISNYGIDTYGPFPTLFYEHIYTMIQGDNPGFMRIETSDGKIGHAIVTYGYYYAPDTSSNKIFYYKDPNYSKTSTGALYPTIGSAVIPDNGTPVITTSGYTFTYDYHITTDY